MELPEGFEENIRSSWAEERLGHIFDLAIEAAWQLKAHGEDHDDQVRTAKELGIMVGKSWSQGLDAFLEAFREWAEDKTEDEDDDD
jgi:hypothetical protein